MDVWNTIFKPLIDETIKNIEILNLNDEYKFVFILILCIPLVFLISLGLRKLFKKIKYKYIKPKI